MGKKRIEPIGKQDFDGDYRYGKHQKWWESLKKTVEQAWGTKPTKIHGQDDWRTEFYRQQAKLLIKGIIKVEVNNEDWDIDYFKEHLLFDGRIGVTDTSMGVIALSCTTSGVNVYNRNNKMLFANPILGNFDRTIGDDGALIYLMDNDVYRNFTPLVDIFAYKLAACDAGIDVNIQNTKVAYVFDCSSEKQANEAKMIYQKISQGEPAVFWENEGTQISLGFYKTDVKSQYVADLLQTEKSAIKAELMTYVGINNTNLEKKERMLYDEINSNNDEIVANIDYVQECVERGVRQTNKLFPELNLRITFPYIEKMKEREQMQRQVNNNESDGRADASSNDNTKKQP